MGWTEKTDARTIIESCGDVLIRGHFVGASGRHLDTYFAKNNVFAHSEQLQRLCRKMWYPFGTTPPWPHPVGKHVFRRAVVGPETGGAKIAQACVADMLAKYATAAKRLGADPGYGPECHAVAVAKTADGLGYCLTDEQAALLKNMDCIVVEDVLTTGGSVRKVVELLTAAEANILRVSAIVNRGGVTAEMLGVSRLQSLLTLNLPSWTAEECKLHGPCSRGEPIRTDFGKGPAQP